MQLSRLLRRSGRTVWLLLVIPVLAAGGAAGMLADSAPPVRTLATVSVIAPEGSSTAATVTQAVDAFESTITSDTVRTLAGQESGTTLGESDVGAQRVGTSNLVELRIGAERGDDGDAAVRALVARANDALFAAPLASAQSRLRNAERRYDAAIEDRARETDRTGLLLPVEAYRAKAAEVTQLRVALATGGSDVDRETLQTALSRAGKDLRSIAESVNAFESLEDRVVRARTELGDARDAADELEVRRAAATAPESFVMAGTDTLSARTVLIRGVATATVVGLGLALGLVLLVGLLRGPGDRNRNRARDALTESDMAQPATSPRGSPGETVSSDEPDSARVVEAVR